jgi:hypothetical protein
VRTSAPLRISDAKIGGVSHDQEVSERVVLQRLRNRAIEAVELLAEGEAGVRSVGANEWVNQFFDVIDDDMPGDWRNWPVLTGEEVAALAEVHDALLDVCRHTPPILVADDFVAGRHPDEIARLARRAVHELLTRGRFSEDVEEAEPGRPIP